MRRVLVTGVTGFVGLHVVPALVRHGLEVHGFGLGDPSPSLPLAGWHAGDLLEGDALGSSVAAVRPDGVLHLAGQSSAAVSFQQPVETYRVNAVGTWALLEAVREHVPRARVVVVGSGEVYGPQPAGTRVGEDAPFRPLSPYALSKAASDALSESFARRHGLEVIRTRSFAHAGPGQSATFAIPSFARQIVAIESGRAEPVLRVGNLEVTRDLCDVRDVVAAYLALLERGRPGRAYNVCRGEGIRLDEVVRRMVARARVPMRVEVDPARLRPADLPWLVGDPEAIQRDVGWRAARPLDRTIDDVLDDWRGARAGTGSEDGKDARSGAH